MSRKKSKKPIPSPTPTVVIANKPKAAVGQFESAILLWFNESDPISILVLASNAHDCYHALGKRIGKPSFHAEFMDTMPESVRERARYIQDFAKHGFKDLDEDAVFDTAHADALMTVCFHSHFKIFGELSLLMGLFVSRIASERPDWVSADNLPKAVRDAMLIDEVAKGGRKECFERFLHTLREIGVHFSSSL